MEESTSNWDVENTDPRLDDRYFETKQRSYLWFKKGVLVLDVLLVCSVVFYFVDSSPFYLVIAIMAMIAFTYIAYRLNRQNRDEPLL